MKRVKTALVGCGKVAGIHAEALRISGASELVGVCDKDASRAQQFATKYGGAPFTDLAALLSEARPDAVVICTPHPLHAEATVAAAEAGAHVLVEKPMAASLEDCDRMIEATRKAGVQLGVVSQRRFYEPVTRMKAAIDAGKIGKPILGVFQMYSWRDEAYYQSDPWRGTWDGEGGGVLVNQSPHQLDILQWLMGPIEEISGYWGTLNHPSIEVDDTAVAVVRFRSGALGSIIASVSQKPGIYTKVHIHGSNGASVGVETDHGATFVAGVSSGVADPPLNDLWTIPGEEDLLAKFESEDRALASDRDVMQYYHALQIDDFLTAINEGRAPAVTGEDGRIVVEMAQAIYRSQRERRPVKL
ncbi:MAG: Gfo/Idh/MocA family oxidoreductase [Acidobacteria bacterium]|nr:Gfo/Idh/MocA family oxidoreductase [Acidobacteriota bacterium]MDA1234008.1 Gfo/Idh/MocA family oxidoreductase [Acidobacteriota bacterium]